MTGHICVTCGAHFDPASVPPAFCPICVDERQYVGYDGQRWTTPPALRETHHTRTEELEPGLVGIGVEPTFAIGQRAVLCQGVLWDCVPLVDDDAARAVAEAGGLRAIAVSHPHFYTGIVEWAERFEAPILLHEADRAFVTRSSRWIEHWSGDRRDIGDGLELIRVGGHFPGATVMSWAAGAGGRGVLLAGDTIQVVADHEWVSFMWSYPNLIPLPAHEIARIRTTVESLEFDRLYGGWWDRVVARDARARVLRSADRYLHALRSPTDPIPAA